MSSSVVSIEISGDTSLTSASIVATASRKPVLGDRRANRLTMRRLELGRQVGIDPLRLADLRTQVLERLADLADLRVRQFEGLEERLLGNLIRTGLDHGQGVGRSDDDQVERGLLERLERRVDDELVVDPADAHGRERAEKRQRRDHERRRRAVDAENVVRRDEVGRERGADEMHLVAEALRPERPDRPVDHAGGERRALGRSSLPLEEAARNLAGGVHPLLDVDRQREEVRVGPRVRPSDGRCEDHRVAGADDDCAVGLLGELARLEDDLLTAHVDGNRGDLPGSRTHVVYPFTYSFISGRWRFESAPRAGWDSLKLPPSLDSSPTFSGRAP